MDELPDYMKPIYRSFLTVYEEIEKEMRKEGRIYTLDYYKAEVCLSAFSNYPLVTEYWPQFFLCTVNYFLGIFTVHFFVVQFRK